MHLMVQAAIPDSFPMGEMVKIFGAIEIMEFDDMRVFLSRPYESKEHLKTLCGTLQTRLERQGIKYVGAVLQPAGVTPPSWIGKYRSVKPLKVNDDYEKGTAMDSLQFDMMPHYQKFYAAMKDVIDMNHLFLNLMKNNDLPESGDDIRTFMDMYKTRMSSKAVVSHMFSIMHAVDPEKFDNEETFIHEQWDKAITFLNDVANAIEVLSKWHFHKDKPAKDRLVADLNKLGWLIDFVNEASPPEYMGAFYKHLPTYMHAPEASNQEWVKAQIKEIQEAASGPDIKGSVAE